jgi:hypothetical protein
VTVLPAALPEPEPEPEPEPAVEVEPPPAAATRLELPTLHELEGLVSAAGDAVPAHRLEEWRWYLFYLRGFASTDGTLPDSFALLVETVFGPLL